MNIGRDGSKIICNIISYKYLCVVMYLNAICHCTSCHTIPEISNIIIWVIVSFLIEFVYLKEIRNLFRLEVIHEGIIDVKRDRSVLTHAILVLFYCRLSRNVEFCVLCLWENLKVFRGFSLLTYYVLRSRANIDNKESTGNFASQVSANIPQLH